MSNVMQLDEIAVGEVMTPRIDMVAVPVDATVEDAMDVMLDKGKLRLPVYEGNLDRIVGILLARDLWRAARDGIDGVREIARPVRFVPHSKPVEELIREMRAERARMIIVLDEFGGTAGLVTLEDLIEEIVGEIQDEHEADEPRDFRVLDDGRVVVWGGTPVKDARERLGIELGEEFDTVGGYVFGALEGVGKAGRLGGYAGRALPGAEGQPAAYRIRAVRPGGVAGGRRRERFPASRTRRRCPRPVWRDEGGRQPSVGSGPPSSWPAAAGAASARIRFSVRSSRQNDSASMTAPHEMAMSATLKMGQCVKPRSMGPMKSTTPWSHLTRSMRLPSAPAITRTRAPRRRWSRSCAPHQQRHHEAERDERHRNEEPARIVADRDPEGGAPVVGQREGHVAAQEVGPGSILQDTLRPLLGEDVRKNDRRHYGEECQLSLHGDEVSGGGAPARAGTGRCVEGGPPGPGANRSPGCSTMSVEWRRRESNPRPEMGPSRLLRA